VNGSYGNFSFANGALTFFGGSSADELVPFYSSGDQFYPNELTARNPLIYSDLWKPAYSYIYQANACIEGLLASTTLSGSSKNQFLGEAMFLRALCYLYLVANYGDVPYVTSAANWATNTTLARTPSVQVYPQIISDLEAAQGELSADYSISGGQRTRANKWAALALLAKAYLYNKNWVGADSAANAVIVSGNFSLVGPDTVFLTNSNEAILQWATNPQYSYDYNATVEGYCELPSYGPPLYYMTTQLLGAFEPGDLRYTDWVDSTVYSGMKYYYPYKYKVGSNQASEAPAKELYVVLRLGEQYLIRAEAEANGAGGGTAAAIADLNVIRNRANLPPLPGTLTGTALFNAVAQERRIELFAEWGNRWLDLKRTGAVDSVMAKVTPLKSGGQPWNTEHQLYPIPGTELLNDPNLIQNPGY
jgi:starch-binding outer membrane protein, SusD/RagB family